jgi:CDP-diacylglycerol---serine O-phosphatidyltransferase
MRKEKKVKKEKSRKGIYILPNIFTSLNLFFGFYAVIASINGRFATAAAAIIIGVLFDIMDGKIARATNTVSKFGIEYDSLADLISFGLAPGIMIYLWSLKPMGRTGWLAAFLFMACGALRLARFNSQVGRTSGDYFIGLPIPAGAGMTATTVLFFHKLGIEAKINPIFILMMLYLLSFLMVSTIKYNSFKRAELFKKMNFNVLVTVILVLIFIAAQPSVSLFILALIYIASGPLMRLKHQKKKTRKALNPSDANEHGSGTI